MMSFDDRIRSGLASVDASQEPDAAPVLAGVLRTGRARRIRRQVISGASVVLVAAAVATASVLLVRRNPQGFVAPGVPRIVHPEPIPSQGVEAENYRNLHAGAARYQVGKGSAHGKPWTIWAFDPKGSQHDRVFAIDYVGMFADDVAFRLPNRPVDFRAQALIGPDLDRPIPNPSSNARRAVAVYGTTRQEIAAVRIHSPWMRTVTVPVVFLEGADGGRVFAIVLAFTGQIPQTNLNAAIHVEPLDKNGEIFAPKPCASSRSDLAVDANLTPARAQQRFVVISLVPQNAGGVPLCTVTIDATLTIIGSNGSPLDIQGNGGRSSGSTIVDGSNHPAAQWSWFNWCGARDGLTFLVHLNGRNITRPVEATPSCDDGTGSSVSAFPTDP